MLSSFYHRQRRRLELSISAIILIMSNAVARSNQRTEETVSLNDDAPQECDATPAIPISVISDLVLPLVPDRRSDLE
jgi:hypothetical protein